VNQAEERENALAYSDALTGLPNRQLFNDRLNMALAQAYRQLGKVALFFLDLDGFKAVNDQLGHDYGDLLLKQVAERLKTCVRSTDTVARLGGDEFTIILAIRDKADAKQVAEKILATVRVPYDLNGKVADKVGTSIGIALYPQDGSQAADLMRKADASMYAAKQAGKNTFRFATMEIVVQG
jgi:diguanylate cyclase (GGDEF)-like protein